MYFHQLYFHQLYFHQLYFHQFDILIDMFHYIQIVQLQILKEMILHQYLMILIQIVL